MPRSARGLDHRVELFEEHLEGAVLRALAHVREGQLVLGVISNLGIQKGIQSLSMFFNFFTRDAVETQSGK